ncbi:hypothetical protein JMF97_30370 [Micromonospora fiedleri]|uniref:Uncharacterized protein n=1 Tax=Micromonospora fiedleri TaxID=1157498 RepID=A0ABS1UVQ7_9ACTN|nr:hypothetical protein [Micromonospora fiedleri]MBL6280466.1 hypothetical protein [Micromonospora fiedleri]
MSAEDPLLDRAAIEDAFRRLGERLHRRGVVADLYIRPRSRMLRTHELQPTTWRAARIRFNRSVTLPNAPTRALG